VLLVSLLLLLGMLEMTLVIVRYTVMVEVAKRIAREAIVHGNLASDGEQWGPAAIVTHAASGSPVALATRNVLTTLDPSEVAIAVTWLDGDNQPDQRVKVSVSYTHQPIISIAHLWSSIELQGSSTMRIAH
jgi:hypothetical protein